MYFSGMFYFGIYDPLLISFAEYIPYSQCKYQLSLALHLFF